MTSTSTPTRSAAEGGVGRTGIRRLDVILDDEILIIADPDSSGLDSGSGVGPKADNDNPNRNHRVPLNFEQISIIPASGGAGMYHTICSF